MFTVFYNYYVFYETYNDVNKCFIYIPNTAHKWNLTINKLINKKKL